jgi:hypothetical protein
MRERKNCGVAVGQEGEWEKYMTQSKKKIDLHVKASCHQVRERTTK